MPFFSYERILRGVLSWRQAAIMSTLLCALCAAILFSTSRIFSLNVHVSIGIFVLVPLALAALIDSVCHILPDPLLFFAVMIVLVRFVFSSWKEIGMALISAAIFFAIGLVMSYMTSLGRGDAKLMGVLALWLGAPVSTFMALLYAFLGAGVFAIVLLMSRRASLASSIALGPWLIGGGCLSWCLLYFT